MARLFTGDAAPGSEDAMLERVRCGLYVSSSGNYFMDEIRDLIAAGLAELGIQAELLDERHAFDRDLDLHIIVAPQELFFIDEGRKLVKQSWPANMVLINVEQPSTPWYQLTRSLFPRAQMIWDINAANVRRHCAEGWPCEYLPLGYVADSVYSRSVERLPRHYGTCSYSPEPRLRSFFHCDFRDRPIDVLFIGSHAPRRELFFARAAPILSQFRCHLHFGDGTVAAIPGKTTFMDTRTAVGLAQRSKIVLNVHRGTDRFFEWHRTVPLGIWQRALLITEPAGSAAPFESGRDFLEVEAENIAPCIEDLLSAPGGVDRAQAIIDQAYRTLTHECRLRDHLRPLLLGALGQRTEKTKIKPRAA